MAEETFTGEHAFRPARHLAAAHSAFLLRFDGDADRLAAPLAKHFDARGRSDWAVRDHPHKLRRIRDGGAVERQDDVAGLEARFVSRRFAMQLVDDDAIGAWRA